MMHECENFTGPEAWTQLVAWRSHLHGQKRGPGHISLPFLFVFVSVATVPVRLLHTMAAAIAAAAAANAKKGRGPKPLTGDPDRFQPSRQLRLIKRDEDGEIIAIPFCPQAEGDSCLDKSKSFCWNLYEFPENSWLSHWVNIFIMGCIVLSALVMVIESLPGAALRY